MINIIKGGLGMKKLLSILVAMFLALALFVTPVSSDESCCENVCETKRIMFASGEILSYIDVDCDGVYDAGVISDQQGITVFTKLGIENVLKYAEENGIPYVEVPMEFPCDNIEQPTPDEDTVPDEPFDKEKWNGHNNCGRDHLSTPVG